VCVRVFGCEKNRWGLDESAGSGGGRDIPLWVSEFGKDADAPSAYWKHLMRFFAQNPKVTAQIRASSNNFFFVVNRRVTLRERGQVGWAYWALNGASPDRSGKRPVADKEYNWANETFGLLHMDYLTTRNPCI